MNPDRLARAFAQGAFPRLAPSCPQHLQGSQLVLKRLPRSPCQQGDEPVPHLSAPVRAHLPAAGARPSGRWPVYCGTGVADGVAVDRRCPFSPSRCPSAGTGIAVRPGPRQHPVRRQQSQQDLRHIREKILSLIDQDGIPVPRIVTLLPGRQPAKGLSA